MKFGEKAEQADRDEIRLARDSMGLYRLESEELVEANDISSEDDFPKYGDFLECMTSSGGAEPEWNTKVLVECPGTLAKELVELEVEVGDAFRIRSVLKNGSGSWEYDVASESVDF